MESYRVRAHTIKEARYEWDAEKKELKQYVQACNAIAWHDITEEPNEQVELLCKWETIDTVYHDVAFYHTNDKTFWNGDIELTNVVKWAYLDELTEQVDAQKSTCTIKPKFKVGN